MFAILNSSLVELESLDFDPTQLGSVKEVEDFTFLLEAGKMIYAKEGIYSSTDSQLELVAPHLISSTEELDLFMLG